MTRRSVLPAVNRTGKSPAWSVKIDTVADIQDTNTLCILAPMWNYGDGCVGNECIDGDIVYP